MNILFIKEKHVSEYKEKLANKLKCIQKLHFAVVIYFVANKPKLTNVATLTRGSNKSIRIYPFNTLIGFELHYLCSSYVDIP